jgi:hypothetical protein
MISFPVVINISGGSVFMVLLSANQVPQKTPVTSTSKIPVSNSIVFFAMVILLIVWLQVERIQSITAIKDK